MARVTLKNRFTTEFKKVEENSEEFRTLMSEINGDGSRKWEIDREVTDERDLGSDVDILPVGLDRGYPTRAEVAQRAGRAKVKHSEPAPEVVDLPQDKYEKLSVPQLKEEIKSRSLSVAPNAKKADLISVLLEDDAKQVGAAA